MIETIPTVHALFIFDVKVCLIVKHIIQHNAWAAEPGAMLDSNDRYISENAGEMNKKVRAAPKKPVGRK